jgi:hypothetical protein
MKRLVIIASIILLTGIITYGVYCIFFKRTPEKILNIVFDISLKGFDYSVETFEEQWGPNGDGHVFIVYKFNTLTQGNIDYLKGFDLKSLPISETEYWQMHSNGILKQFFNANSGYYLFRTERISTIELKEGIKMALDFYIFVIDTENKMAVLYYSSM